MIQGETTFLKCPLDIDVEEVNEVIFTLKDIYGNTVSLTYPTDVIFAENVFLLPLHQEDTLRLKGIILVEAQINFKDLSVRKSSTEKTRIGDTLATKIIEGNTPSEGDYKEVKLTIEEVKLFLTTDKTLTKADVPADAKACGDRIAELEERITLLESMIGYPIGKDK